MHKSIRFALTLFFWLIVIGPLLIQCKKSNEEPFTPTPTQDPIVPGVNVGLGAQLLDKAAYEKIPLLPDPLAGGRLAAGGKDPNLPGVYDLSVNTPPAGNQGIQGSCTAWAVAYAARSYFNKVAKNTNYKTTDGTLNPESAFSPAFVFNQTKLGGCSDGSYLNKALDFVQNTGVCTLKDMPYSDKDCSTQPTADQRQKASAYKIKSWGRVNIQTNTFRRYLYFDYPIIVAALLDDNFKQLREKDANGEFIWKTYDAAKASGGHAMVLVGYDDTRKAFKVQNSWSERWANKGYIWLSYDIVDKAVYEAYVMATGDNPNLKPPKVQTGTATKLANGQALFTGTITELGDEPVLKYGICVSNIPELPTTQYEVTDKTVSTLPHAFSVTPPLTGRQLYYRAFAQTATNIIYGDTLSIALNQSSVNGDLTLTKDLKLTSIGGPTSNNTIYLYADFTNTSGSNFVESGFIILPTSFRKGDISTTNLTNSPRINLGPITKSGITRLEASYSNVVSNSTYKCYAYVKTNQGATLINDTVISRPAIFQAPPVPNYSGNTSIKAISSSFANRGSVTYLPTTKTYYFFADYQILQWKEGQTTQTFLAGASGGGSLRDGTGSAAVFFSESGQIVPDGQGNLYVASSRFIRRISPQGIVTTVAGSGGQLLDGKGSQAGFTAIQDMVSDEQGTLWMIDNYTIRKMTADGTVTTVCGTPPRTSNTADNLYIDGSLSSARFKAPRSITIDKSGTVYVLDDNRIRKISSSGVSTYAGREVVYPKYGFDTDYFSYYTDGQLPAVDLYRPEKITVDNSGNLYLLDTWAPAFNRQGTTLRKLTPEGKLTTLLGNSVQRNARDGTGSNARFADAYNTNFLWVDNSLQLYEYGSSLIRKITF